MGGHRWGLHQDSHTRPRAGWGYASDHPAIGHNHGEAKGKAQTAQRGEAPAVAHALTMGCGRLHILTDSKYVAITLDKVKEGIRPQGKRQDIWTKVWEHKDRLARVTWVKAHLSQEQAKEKAIPHESGHPGGHGVQAHTEDPSAWALWDR